MLIIMFIVWGRDRLMRVQRGANSGHAWGCPQSTDHTAHAHPLHKSSIAGVKITILFVLEDAHTDR